MVSPVTAAVSYAALSYQPFYEFEIDNLKAQLGALRSPGTMHQELQALITRYTRIGRLGDLAFFINHFCPSKPLSAKAEELELWVKIRQEFHRQTKEGPSLQLPLDVQAYYYPRIQKEPMAVIVDVIKCSIGPLYGQDQAKPAFAAQKQEVLQALAIRGHRLRLGLYLKEALPSLVGLVGVTSADIESMHQCLDVQGEVDPCPRRVEDLGPIEERALSVWRLGLNRELRTR